MMADTSVLIKQIEELENHFFAIAKLNELNDRMDRIKVLMDATEMSMEELMAETAPGHITCNTCPISEFCDQHPYNEVTELGCSDIWTLYLRGETGGETDGKA